MIVSNGAGDCIGIRVFCNTEHNLTNPTEMVEYNKELISPDAPDIIRKGKQLRCPKCHRIVIISDEEAQEKKND